MQMNAIPCEIKKFRYLWGLLINLPQKQAFYEIMMEDSTMLFDMLVEEAGSGSNQDAVSQLTLNLSLHQDLSGSVACLPLDQLPPRRTFTCHVHICIL
jgi:hypothetical protein